MQTVISKDSEIEIPSRLKRTAKKFRLTMRETEVVAVAMHDSTRKIIADRLGISINTVDFHLKNIFQKVGAHTRGGLITATYANQ